MPYSPKYLAVRTRPIRTIFLLSYCLRFFFHLSYFLPVRIRLPLRERQRKQPRQWTRTRKRTRLRTLYSSRPPQIHQPSTGNSLSGKILFRPCPCSWNGSEICSGNTSGDAVTGASAFSAFE